jgi:photosystem II stability/assembly factor-like uncharacterized protein
VGGLWDHALILHTSNGGNIWSQERDDDPAPAELLAVSFSDGKNWMAVGYYGTIMSTRTGGASWNAIQTYFMNTYFGAYMYNQTIGFAVGVSNIFYPLVTRTTDGWQTFEHFSFPIKNNDELWEADLTDVEFISPTVGFATARVAYSHGAIIYTADAGETWKTVYWNNDGNILGIEFVSEDIGYAVGDRGLILKTDDGGQHWGRLHSGIFFRLHDVSFASKQVGTAVGDNGFILRTISAGRTWFWQYSGTVASLHAIQLINEKEGFIVGENGIILHTTTGGIPS